MATITPKKKEIEGATIEKTTKLRDFYIEQQKNSSAGDELYGITERLNKYTFVKAEMQNYLKDFYINEIDLRGREAVLTEVRYPTRVPSDPNEIRKLTFIKKGFLNASTFNFVRNKIKTMKKDEDFDIDVDYLNEKEILELHKSLQILQDIRPNALIYEDKSRRFKDKKCLRVSIYNDSKKELKEKWGWKDSYLHFTLRTANTPFRKPLGTMATVLKMTQQDFQFAQLKEAMPVSYQKVSVKLPKREAVQALVARKDDSFKVGDLVIKSRPLQVGELFGNKFQLAFRGLETPAELLEKCLDYLQKTGFVNYFGAKRFSCRKCVPVHEIGRALLTRNWQEAVDLLLRPTTEDVTALKEFKERWFLTNGNPEKTFIDEFTSDEYEYKMICKLREKPGDYLAALEEVPFNFRLGYVFAYQSYIWNVIASQRIKRKGLKIVEGDIVFKGKEEDLKPEFHDDYGIPVYSRSQPYTEVKRNATDRPNFKDKIHFVTPEDVQGNKYTIYDLVLPTPGSVVMFPKNDVGIWYTDFLSKDGLNKTRLGDKYFVDEKIVMNSYFLHGTYRRVLLKLDEFTWKFKNYKSIEDQIIPTANFDKFLGTKEVKKGNEDAEKLALQLEFTLPSDAYVMVALRELFDLNDSGLNYMTVKYKEAREKEKKEMEPEKPKERLDGGALKPKSSSTLSRSRSKSKSAKAISIDRTAQKTISIDRAMPKPISVDRAKPKPVSVDRTVKKTKQNFIEVRLTNPDNARVNKDQRKIPPRPVPPPSNFGSFDQPGPLGPGPGMIDGVQVYEFQTVAPQMERSFEEPARSRWVDQGPSQPSAPVDNRRSVFEGRLEDRSRIAGSRQRSDYDPAFVAHQEREFKAGRLQAPPPWIQNDDRRDQQMSRNVLYDPEREIEAERYRRMSPPKRSAEPPYTEYGPKIRRVDPWDQTPFERLGPRVEPFDDRFDIEPKRYDDDIPGNPARRLREEFNDRPFEVPPRREEMDRRSDDFGRRFADADRRPVEFDRGPATDDLRAANFNRRPIDLDVLRSELNQRATDLDRRPIETDRRVLDVRPSEIDRRPIDVRPGNINRRPDVRSNDFDRRPSDLDRRPDVRSADLERRSISDRRTIDFDSRPSGLDRRSDAFDRRTDDFQWRPEVERRSEIPTVRSDAFDRRPEVPAARVDVFDRHPETFNRCPDPPQISSFDRRAVDTFDRRTDVRSFEAPITKNNDDDVRKIQECLTQIQRLQNRSPVKALRPTPTFDELKPESTFRSSLPFRRSPSPPQNAFTSTPRPVVPPVRNFAMNQDNFGNFNDGNQGFPQQQQQQQWNQPSFNQQQNFGRNQPQPMSNPNFGGGRGMMGQGMGGNGQMNNGPMRSVQMGGNNGQMRGMGGNGQMGGNAQMGIGNNGSMGGGPMRGMGGGPGNNNGPMGGMRGNGPMGGAPMNRGGPMNRGNNFAPNMQAQNNFNNMQGRRF